MHNKRAGSQPFAGGPADWFSGPVRIDAPCLARKALR
jgi:hypothetical protein